MKNIVINVLVILTIFSCKSNRIIHKCKDDLVHKLEYLSGAISFNKNTKVYTLHYSKLPDLNHDRYLKLSDSLENITYLPHDINMVKHFLYCKELKALIQPNCKMTIKMLRDHFGEESNKGTENDEIHSLFFLFNFEGKPDCYERYAEFGPYSKCSLLTFKVEKETITDVLSETFGY